MHHVSDDVRTRRSAGLIWEGLVEMLHEKPLERVHVADVCERSYVSRATFYRLFDGIDDVLAYECDLVYQDVPTELEGMRLATTRDALTYFVGHWLARRELMEVIANTASTGLVLDAHLRNAEIVREVCAWEDVAGGAPACMDAVLAGLVAAAVGTWCAHDGGMGLVDVVDEVLGGTRVLVSEHEIETFASREETPV